MKMSKSLIQRLKFIVRHDYANPTARVSLDRNECIAILNYLGEPTHRTGIKTSEHCTTCFNDDNEIGSADFQVVTKVGRHYMYYCRHHFVVWFDLFTHAELGDGRYPIPYEIKRLRKYP